MVRERVRVIRGCAPLGIDSDDGEDDDDVIDAESGSNGGNNGGCGGTCSICDDLRFFTLLVVETAGACAMRKQYGERTQATSGSF